MTGETLTFVGLTDLAGKLRGKAVPAARVALGVGWVPTNALITCFDGIGAGPYGSLGDLLLRPDADTFCELPGRDGAPGFRLVLGSVADLDGAPWACCTRTALRTALDRFEAASGLRVVAAFEQEFQLPGLGRPPGDAFGFHGFRAAQGFGEELIGAMTTLGFAPEQFIREYGADQFEVTMAPAPAMQSADRATVLQALVRDIAPRHGHQATVTPIAAPDAVGNGVHIHFSLVAPDGTPTTHDPARPYGLSEAAGRAAAGILAHLHEIVAFLAPGVVSYVRLTPHRWSAAFNNLGFRDREAALRICPVAEGDPNIAAKFNLELRAADAAASPHLALAAAIHAMAEGVERQMAAPKPTTGDLSERSAEALAAAGLRRLPTTLAEAMAACEGSAAVRRWFGDELVGVYAALKAAEMAHVAEAGEARLFDLYRAVY